jgi:hypothetical protein
MRGIAISILRLISILMSLRECGNKKDLPALSKFGLPASGNSATTLFLPACQLCSKAFPHFNFALIVALAAAAASSSSYSLPLACDVTMETIR